MQHQSHNMAKILYTSTMHSIKGRAQGTVFKMVGGIGVVQAQNWSKGGFSSGQSQSRASFSIKAGQWRALTPEQQAEWYTLSNTFVPNSHDKHSGIQSAFRSWMEWYKSGINAYITNPKKWNRAYANFCLGQLHLSQESVPPYRILIGPPSTAIVESWAFQVSASNQVPTYMNAPRYTWRTIYEFPLGPVATSPIDLSTPLLNNFGQPIARPYWQPLRFRITQAYNITTANEALGPSKYAVYKMPVVYP